MEPGSSESRRLSIFSVTPTLLSTVGKRLWNVWVLERERARGKEREEARDTRWRKMKLRTNCMIFKPVTLDSFEVPLVHSQNSSSIPWIERCQLHIWKHKGIQEQHMLIIIQYNRWYKYVTFVTLSTIFSSSLSILCSSITTYEEWWESKVGPRNKHYNLHRHYEGTQIHLHGASLHRPH